MVSADFRLCEKKCGLKFLLVRVSVSLNGAFFFKRTRYKSHMRILMTGATGFIGQRLMQMLEPHQVTALVRKKIPNNGLVLPDWSASALHGVLATIPRPDCLIHVAGVTASLSQQGFFEGNAELTRRLMQVSHALWGDIRVIVISSLAAGGPSVLRTQKDLDAPCSWYGKSKLLAEQEAQAFYPQACLIRPPIVYGPEDRGLLVLARSIARGFGVVAGSKKRYSVIYVDDLCQSIVQAVSLTQSGVHYVAEREAISGYDLMATMAKVLKKPLYSLPDGLVPTMTACAAGGAQLIGLLRGKASALNWDKRREILPDHWVCEGMETVHRYYETMPQVIAAYQAKGWI